MVAEWQGLLRPPSPTVEVAQRLKQAEQCSWALRDELLGLAEVWRMVLEDKGHPGRILPAALRVQLRELELLRESTGDLAADIGQDD